MSELPETYSTVAQRAQVKLPVGQCRFFASVSEVRSEEEAKAFLAEITAQFKDANHHAFAYRIGWREPVLARSSDAGEPANTAGPPMLQVLSGAGLTDVMVVATRYFGGVKLGVGGLIRAYRDSAQAGLLAAGVRTETIKLPIVISDVDYALLGEVLRELASLGADILDIGYQLRVTVRAAIAPKDEAALAVRITDITRGQCQLEVVK